MIDKHVPILITAAFFTAFLLLGTAGNAGAQFIDLRLDIEPRLTATSEQPLEFGKLSTNSGRRMIELGSVNMGIFSITGLENQMLLVTLNKPDVLEHKNPAIKEVVPLQLYARYGYSSQNYQNSVILPEDSSNINVEPNPEPGPWNTIYLFMYGSVDIGNLPEGVYTNEIRLNVEYI